MKKVTKQQKSTISLLAFLLVLCMALSLQAQVVAPIGIQNPSAEVDGLQQSKNGGAQPAQVIPGRYIVVLKKNAATQSLKSKTLVERKKAMQELAVSTMERNNLSGAKVEIVYGTALIGFAVSDLSEADAEKLRRDAQVDYIEQDQMVFLEDNDGHNSSTLTPGKANSYSAMPLPLACSILTVNGQAYNNGSATFGQNSFNVTGDIVLVDDGTAPTSDACQAIQNNVTGNIALLDLGMCYLVPELWEFGFKALQAQNAGAIAVIIANNVPGAPPSMDAGGYGSSVTIPVISVSLADGNAIKAELNNGPVTATLDNQLTVQCTPWGITRVGGGLSGAGKRAWIIDSGIDLTHPDLNVNTALSTFFAGTSPQDENGHGTHVAGTIAAKDNSFGVVGVAAGAEVVSVRVFDASNSGPASVIIQGVDYVAANAAAGDVANMSLTSGVDAALDTAVLAASVTCKFVLAAGNDGEDANLTSPARVNGPNVYTVSAMDINDNFASFSNYGNAPVDYCEPGVGVLSCWLNGVYNIISGTSMAAPHLSGLLLLGNICGGSFVNGDPDETQDMIGVHDTGTSPDNDGDGFSACEDCDDNDASIYPGAPELCDGIDNNCDGIIDNGNVCCTGSSILYVNANATGINNGADWANAFTNLQSAFNNTCPGVTQIWVAAGTYKPTPTQVRGISFVMKNGVAIYGGFPNTGNPVFADRNADPATNGTILSGDIDGDNTLANNSYHVIFNDDNGLNATAVLDGFTITGGRAAGSFKNYGAGMLNNGSSPTLTNCTFSENYALSGGGMFNYSSSPTLTNCTFSENSAYDSGGMFNYSSSSPTLTDCTFSGNYAVNGAGGMWNLSSSPTLTDCTFSGNFAMGGVNGGGGGMINQDSSSSTLTNCTFSGNSATNNFGGGMYNASASPTLINCTFSGNSANYGGGMFNGFSSSPTLANCSFSGNSVEFNGGGMSNFIFSSPTLTNCLFSGNFANGTDPNVGAGGMYNYDNSSPTLTNCTFSGNSTIGIGGGMRNHDNSSPTLANCILWGNSSEIIDQSSTPTVTYSIVQGGYSPCTNCPNGNGDIDPLFVGPTNLRLQHCSPAIDAGNDVANTTLTDLDGNPRKFDVIPGGTLIDLGAYERSTLPAFYVKSNATGLNNGATWADAFTSLQSALASTCPGVTEIWVAAGTYKPTTGTDRNISFVMKNGVAIYGGFPNTGDPGFADRNADPATNGTILSGDIGTVGVNTDNSYHVIFNNFNGLNATAVLDGFTITGGNADGSFPNNNGGGMLNSGSSPTLTNCTFSGNSAAIIGGGMVNTSSSPTLTNCAFSGNSAVNNGGGMANNNSYPTLTNCTFSGNSAINGGGGGMHNFNFSSPTLTNCILWGNGGEIFDQSSPPTVTYSIVQGGYSPCTNCPNGNGDIDPLFVGPTNLRLQPCSPAIDAGNDAANTTLTDLDGNPRKFDAIPGGTLIDLGAYERPTLPTFYVKSNAIGLNNGATWADAFTSLQSALTSTCPGVAEIWVAEGTYKPTTGTDRNIFFVMKNGVAIYGGFPNTGDPGFADRNADPATNGTILSGDIGTVGVNTDNSYHVIFNYFNGLNATAVLDGFTITGGNANGGFPNDNGGGMLNSGSSPTLTNCTFSGNSAAIIGGGMLNSGSSPTLTNCTFSGNSAAGAGGGGGGMWNQLSSSPTLTNCSFSGNSAANNGGGMANSQSSPALTNCSFSGNSSDGAVGGGGMLNFNFSSPTLTNCSFSGNSTNGIGGGMYNLESSPTLANCILWGNSSEIFNVSSTSTVTYSIVQGGYGVSADNNLDEDPLFVSQPPIGLGTSGDLHLTACSPGIDAGNDAANATTTDLAGNARKFEAIPGGQMIDMGAYEFQSIVSATNTWTGNGDGLLWSDPANWSNGFVPGRCQDVVIPTGTVTIPAGFDAVGKTLDVATGVLLETAPTARMDIKNN